MIWFEAIRIGCIKLWSGSNVSHGFVCISTVSLHKNAKTNGMPESLLPVPKRWSWALYQGSFRTHESPFLFQPMNRIRAKRVESRIHFHKHVFLSSETKIVGWCCDWQQASQANLGKWTSITFWTLKSNRKWQIM